MFVQRLQITMNPQKYFCQLDSKPDIQQETDGNCKDHTADNDRVDLIELS